MPARRSRRLHVRPLAVGLVALGLTFVASAVAWAHEDRLVADRYNVAIGYAVEPPQVDEPNFLDVVITDITKDYVPVMGLEGDIRLELTLGDDTRELPLYAKTDRPGYRAEVTPDKPGFQNVRLFGVIDETNIDETFQLEPVEGTASTAVSTQTTVIGGALLLGAAGAGIYFLRGSRRHGHREGRGRGQSEPI